MTTPSPDAPPAPFPPPPGSQAATPRWAALVVRVGLVGMLTLVGACAGNQPDGPDTPSTATSAPPTSAPITVGSVDPDRLPVYVVVEDIPAGTTAEAAVEQSLLEAATRPFTEFPEDAVVTLDLLAGTVAAADLAAGEVLVAGMFVDPDARGPEPGAPTGTGPPTTAEQVPPTTTDAGDPSGTGTVDPPPGL